MECVLVIFTNIHAATLHNFGRDFREPLRTLRQAYRYNYKHDEASLADVNKQLSAADALRDTADASAPESANTVGYLMSLLSDVVTSFDSADKYDETTLAVSKTSNSDSSHDTTRRRTSRHETHNK